MRIFYLGAFLFISIVSFAQEVAPLNTDRPSQSASSTLVPKGRLQVETGLVLEQDGRDFSNFNTLIRWGVNDFVELRFQQDYLSSESTPENFSGFSATKLGIKSVIAREEGWMPEIALVGNIALPSGESIYQTQHTTPDFRFAVSKAFSDQFSIGYNLGTQWDSDSPRSTTFYTIILGMNLSENFAAFFEPYGFIRKNEMADSRLNGGFTYLVQPMLQLDVSAGVGLTEGAPDSFVSFGASFAF